MSERWKPVDTYYFIDSIGMVGSYKWCDASVDNAYYKSGNCFETRVEAEAAAEKVKTLLLNLHEPTTECNQLPKLTAEVFDRENCPEWAKWAAVDSCGNAYFYTVKPQAHRTRWGVSAFCKFVNIGKFDASDWQNSLIKRPAKETKLPDWCKVDAIGWHKRCGYFKVTYIDDVSKRIDIQQVEDKSKGYLSFYTVCNETTRARLRPYNTEEMPDLPFGIKDKNSNFRTTVVSCKGDKVWLAGELTAISTEELLRGFTIKGKACGVLEHLENGEWLE